MPHHLLHSYRTLDEFLTALIGPGYSKAHKRYRFWVQKWNAWKSRHPGLPYRVRCPICSGEEDRISRKLGWRKPGREQRRREEIWE